MVVVWCAIECCVEGYLGRTMRSVEPWRSCLRGLHMDSFRISNIDVTSATSTCHHTKIGKRRGFCAMTTSDVESELIRIHSRSEYFSLVCARWQY